MRVRKSRPLSVLVDNYGAGSCKEAGFPVNAEEEMYET